MVTLVPQQDPVPARSPHPTRPHYNRGGSTGCQEDSPGAHLRCTKATGGLVHRRLPRPPEAHPGHMGTVRSRHPDLTPPSPAVTLLPAPNLTAPSEGIGHRGVCLQGGPAASRLCPAARPVSCSGRAWGSPRLQRSPALSVPEHIGQTGPLQIAGGTPTEGRGRGLPERPPGTVSSAVRLSIICRQQRMQLAPDHQTRGGQTEIRGSHGHRPQQPWGSESGLAAGARTCREGAVLQPPRGDYSPQGSATVTQPPDHELPGWRGRDKLETEQRVRGPGPQGQDRQDQAQALGKLLLDSPLTPDARLQGQPGRCRLWAEARDTEARWRAHACLLQSPRGGWESARPAGRAMGPSRPPAARPCARTPEHKCT